MQAGVICWRPGPLGPEVLLVKTSDGERFIFPKGHVKAGETGAHAALRELAEEAGMTARIETTPGYRIEWRGEVLLLFTGSEAAPLSSAFEPGREPQWHPVRTARSLLQMGRVRADAEPLLLALHFAASRSEEPANAGEASPDDEKDEPFQGRWCPNAECRGLLSYRRAHRGESLQTSVWCWRCGWEKEVHTEADYPPERLVSAADDGSSLASERG